MREKKRQEILRSSQGITLANAQSLRSSVTTFSGCLSGSGWAGIRFWLNGNVKIGGETIHRQNNAPTGWERRGEFHGEEALTPIKRGDKITWRGQGNLLQHPEALTSVEKFFGGWKGDPQTRVVI